MDWLSEEEGDASEMGNCILLSKEVCSYFLTFCIKKSGVWTMEGVNVVLWSRCVLHNNTMTNRRDGVCGSNLVSTMFSFSFLL